MKIAFLKYIVKIMSIVDTKDFYVCNIDHLRDRFKSYQFTMQLDEQLYVAHMS